jgi:hypothetical protein
VSVAIERHYLGGSNPPRGHKRFFAYAEVSFDFYKGDRELAESSARDLVSEELSGDLRGPRGGRYVPVGPIRWDGWGVTSLGLMLYSARRMARYVRPK